MRLGLNIPPLQAVGWEGVIGFVVAVLSTLLLLVVFYWIPTPPHFGHNAHSSLEDAVDGLEQIGNNLLLSTIVSIAVFNFAGITFTKEMSATARMVLDSVRILVIWMFSLAVSWQDIHWQHLLGFAVSTVGMGTTTSCPPAAATPASPATRRNIK